MAERQIFEGGYDVGTTVRSDDWYSKFNVLGERVEKMKKEIVATKGCFEYVLKEIVSENEIIERSLKWNEKRLNLLSELTNKNNIMCDKLNNMYEEMFELIKCNFETQNNLIK